MNINIYPKPTVIYTLMLTFDQLSVCPSNSDSVSITLVVSENKCE